MNVLSMAKCALRATIGIIAARLVFMSALKGHFCKYT